MAKPNRRGGLDALLSETHAELHERIRPYVDISIRLDVNFIRACMSTAVINIAVSTSTQPDPTQRNVVALVSNVNATAVINARRSRERD